MSFPAATPSYDASSTSQTLNEFNHLTRHTDMQTDLIGLSGKVGTGASTPTIGKVLRANGTGTSEWADADLTTDVTGTLPVANGGTGVTTSTGTGAVVRATSPALVTPTGIVKGDVGLTNVDNTSDLVKLAVIYPIGCIYTETTGVNPGTTFGFGTWTAFGAGKVLVGKAAAGTFSTAGATGGVETVTLTAAQSGVPAHTHGYVIPSGGGALGAAGVTSNAAVSAADANATANAAEAHTNLQPYLVVFFWHRDA